MAKEYCIIQSGSPADLSKVVQENLDQGWEPYGNLVYWPEHSYAQGQPCVYDWFIQPIVRDSPTAFRRSVHECPLERFKEELETLCIKYGVGLSHGRDAIELWDRDRLSNPVLRLDDYTEKGERK